MHREGVRLKPDLAKCHYNLGAALEGQGKIDEAIAEYTEALASIVTFRKPIAISVAHSADRGSSTRGSPSAAKRSGYSPTSPKLMPISVAHHRTGEARRVDR